MRVYPQYWMVYTGKSENKMDDWGYRTPMTLESSIFTHGDSPSSVYLPFPAIKNIDFPTDDHGPEIESNGH
jgi:hypothetical protein